MKRPIVFALVLTGIVSTPAAASEITIGLLSFDVVIPAGNSPGIDAFDIYNFTGSTYGPFAGVPFVADSLTLDDAILTVYFPGGSSQVALGPDDIGPGELPGGFQFPSSTQFVSATLTATLGQTAFTLSGGSTFIASPTISVELTPSSGGVLVAGVDFAPIYAESAAVGTPEPYSVVLLALGLVGIGAWRRR